MRNSTSSPSATAPLVTVVLRSARSNTSISATSWSSSSLPFCPSPSISLSVTLSLNRSSSEVESKSPSVMFSPSVFSVPVISARLVRFVGSMAPVARSSTLRLVLTPGWSEPVRRVLIVPSGLSVQPFVSFGLSSKPAGGRSVTSIFWAVILPWLKISKTNSISSPRLTGSV